MDSASSSSSTNPSFVFTCSMDPDCVYGLGELNRHRKLIDIHLKIGDKKHPAHRTVLSSSSPVLAAMLSDKWDPERKDVCELGEDVVDPSIADDLLDFFYVRKVTITMANAKQLCIAANYLDIPTLKTTTDRFLADHVRFSTDDIVEWLNFSTMYQLHSLHKACAKYVFENYANVLKMDKLLSVPEDFLMQLLKDLKEFESSIVNRAMFVLLIKWIKFDITTRSDCLLNFLKMFPFLEVPEKFITDTVLKEETIINSQDCLQLVNQSLNELSSLSKAKHLYCIGSSLYHLDVEAGRWTPKSPMMHLPYEFFCSATIADKIYIFGAESNIVQVLDTKHDRWTELPRMPDDHEWAAAVALNGYIYVSGGYDAIGRHLRSVDRYCVATKEWTSVAPMLEARAYHKMIAFNDFIYAIGEDWNGNEATVEKYSPEADQWEMVPAFELQLGDFTALHQDKFFTFNLRPENLIKNVDTVNIYDPLTDSTETFQDSGAVQVFKVDAHWKCVSVGDKIWALKDYGGILGEFNPATRKWRKLDIDMSILGVLIINSYGDAYYEVVVPQR